MLMRFGSVKARWIERERGGEKREEKEEESQDVCLLSYTHVLVTVANVGSIPKSFCSVHNPLQKSSAQSASSKQTCDEGQGMCLRHGPHEHRGENDLHGQCQLGDTICQSSGRDLRMCHLREQNVPQRTELVVVVRVLYALCVVCVVCVVHVVCMHLDKVCQALC